jgi:hypothetical protein
LDYEGLLEEAYSLNLIVKEAEIYANKGRIKGNRIAIRKDIPTLKEKSCILAEELGHYYTSYGDILDQSTINNRKQELKARLWAYNKQIGLTGIIRAYEYGCYCLYDMADYLDVTEEFLHDAIKYYRGKYGEYTTLDNYIIYFEPNLGVFKLIQ